MSSLIFLSRKWSCNDKIAMPLRSQPVLIPKSDESALTISFAVLCFTPPQAHVESASN